MTPTYLGYTPIEGNADLDRRFGQVNVYVRDYVAAGYVPGTTDAGPAFQLALTAAQAAIAAGAGAARVIFPPGRVRLATRSDLYTSGLTGSVANGISIHGAGVHATFLEPEVAPVLRVGDGVFNVEGFALRDLTVRLTRNLWWDAGVFQFRIVRGLDIENVNLWDGPSLANLYQFTGYLFEFDTCYLMRLARCETKGRRVYLFEIHSTSRPAEQMDTFTFQNLHCFGVGGGIIRTSIGNIHGLTLTGFKHLLDVGFAEANVSDETTVSGAHLAGVVAVTCVAAPAATGGVVWLGTGELAEMVSVQSVVGNVLNLNHPTKFAHASGEQVLRGGVGLHVGPNVFGLALEEPHFEYSACGLALAGTKVVTVRQPHGTPRDVVRVVRDGVQDVVVERAAVTGNSGVCNLTRVTALGDGANVARLIDVGPHHLPGTGNVPVPYVNDAGTQRWHRTIAGKVAGYLVDDSYNPSGTQAIRRTYLNGVLVLSETVAGSIVSSGDLDFGGGYRQQIDGWYLNAVAASQTNVQMTRTSGATDNPSKFFPTRPGSITGVQVHSDAARTNGTLTVTVFLNGVATALTAVLDGTNTTAKVSFSAKDVIPYGANAQIDPRVTTDGVWAPGTANIRVTVEVEG